MPILANLYYFRPDFLPVADMMDGFCHFFYFYNEFYFHHHLARWMPTSFYGIPTIFPQLNSISPMNYFFGLIGFLLRVQNVLLLWKVSIVLEQLFFVSGLYLLSRRLFISKSAVFFICLGGSLSILWWDQIIFNYRLYTMVPWILYCMITFFYERRPEYFWVAGIFGISSLLGIIPYVIGMWLFCFTLFTLVMSFWYWPAWKKLFAPRRSNLILAFVFIFLVVAYVYFAQGMRHGVSFAHLNRDPRTGECPVDIFVKHGGIPTASMVLNAFILPDTQTMPLGDGNLVYVGLLPLIFFVWSLFTARHPVYYGLLVTMLALIALSFGGPFARFVYHFPLMGYYRHIGYIYSLIKILLLFCAGYGWVRFWESPRNGYIRRIALVSIFLLILLTVKATSYPLWACGLIILWGMSMAIWIWRYRKSKGRFLKISLMLIFLGFFAVDMSFFQHLLYRSVPLVPASFRSYLDAFKIHRWQYQPKRRFVSEEGSRQYQALALLQTPGQGPKYSWEYAFAQEDLCLPKFPEHMRTTDLHYITKINSILPAILGGCYEPKLRLFAYGEYVSLNKEKEFLEKINGVLKGVVGHDKRRMPMAMQLARRLMQDTVYIRIPESSVDLPPIMQERLPSEAVGDVRVVLFNTDEFTAEVDVARPGGGWLFVANPFHPDWHALVDGKNAKIWVANGTFQAVYLDKGKHVIRFFFDQGLVSAAGVFMAIFGLIMGGLYCFIILRSLFDNSDGKIDMQGYAQSLH